MNRMRLLGRLVALSLAAVPLGVLTGIAVNQAHAAATAGAGKGIGAAAAVIPAGAGDAARHGGVDLVSLLQHAELNDPGYAAARQQAIADAEGKGRAISAFFPRIEGGWAKARTNIKTQGEPSFSYTQSGWQISLTQPLFDREIWVNYKQAELQQTKAEMQLELAHQALLLRGVGAYLDVLMACDEVELVRLHLDSLRGQLQIARKRFKAGASTLIDLRDIDVEISRAQADFSTATASMGVKRNALEDVYGGTIGSVFALADLVSIPAVYPNAVSDWEAQAKQSNLDIQLQEMERRSASLETSKAHAGHLPKVSLSASHSPTSAVTGLSAPSTTNSIMLQVQIPIFSGFDTRHQVRQSLALEEKAGYELEAAERKTLREVRESFLLAQAGQTRIAQLESVVAVSQSAVDATQIGYRIGNRADADLLRAQGNLRSARKELLRTRYEVLLHGVRLKALVGVLRIEDIAWLNTLLMQQRALDDSGR